MSMPGSTCATTATISAARSATMTRWRSSRLQNNLHPEEKHLFYDINMFQQHDSGALFSVVDLGRDAEFEDAVETEEVEDVTAIVEENKQLKESMAQIMARLDAMENKGAVSEPLQANDDAEYKAELKAEIKALGGKLQGLITIDQLEKRLSELNNED